MVRIVKNLKDLEHKYALQDYPFQLVQEKEHILLRAMPHIFVFNHQLRVYKR